MGKSGVLGVGINDADYPIVKFSEPDAQGKRKQTFRCPYYFRWHGMLSRCFNKGKSTYRLYEKTTVCEDWLTFSNFKKWMEGCDWEGKVLDKDLRGDGTLYSPETCTWMSSELNSFIADVSWDKAHPIPGVFISNRYDTQVIFNNEKMVERFETVDEAISCYIEFKLDIASTLHRDNYEDVVRLYTRRKEQWLKFVYENRELFPVLDQPIRHACIPKVGDRFQTNKGYWYTVKEYRNTGEVIIEFDTGEVKPIHNCQIKTGVIRCKSGQEIKEGEKISKRVDKYFKINKHNLLVGITPYGDNLFGVSCGRTILYYRTLEDAICVRKEKVIDVGIEKLVKQYPLHKEQIEMRYKFWLEKFNSLGSCGYSIFL